MSPSLSIPDPRQDFKNYQESLYKALLSATAASNSISSEDLSFYRSLDQQLAKDLDVCSSKVLQIANRFTKHVVQDTGNEVRNYEDLEDVENQFGNVIEVVDTLLERADICLDEMQGRVKKPDETTPVQRPERNKKLESELYYAKDLMRPQMKFKDKVDNSADMPFVPKIRYKPHAKVPLDQILTIDMDDPEALRSIPHPYEYEIKHLEYPDHMLEEREPIKYHPFDETSAHWVETGEQLENMMNDFNGIKELAIDLEHHNYRSFQGFTCLMQISTRDEDYIVDTLALRDQLWQLNEYFANPEIVKVLHGAESDIVWLQRDFGLYIVNMFDTYFATKALDYPMHSLAYLLNKFCSVEADKKYQLADWRIRPLPEEMLKYARADTHYLLYIYDCLRNTLLQGSTGHENLLRTVLQNSNQVALKTYEKEGYDAEFGMGPNGWNNLLRKWKHPMTNQQHAVFRALHAWRDHTAREEDESLRYVLPNHMLFALVERMPTEASDVIGCCNPCPPLVRMNAQALATLIHRAKMEGLKTVAPQTRDLDEEGPAPVAIPETIVQSAVAKVVKERVDPSAFDLERIDRERAEAAAKMTKPVSALFGSGEENMEAQLDKDLAAERLAEAIKSRIKLIQPLDGVKFITRTGEEIKQRHVELSNTTSTTTPTESKPSVSQQSAITPVEPAAVQEHVYTRVEERTTKKRPARVDDDEDNDYEVEEDKQIVRVKDTMVKKKKKNKKKKVGQQ